MTKNIEEIWKEAPHPSWKRLKGPGFWYEDRHGRLYWREGMILGSQRREPEGFEGPERREPEDCSPSKKTPVVPAWQ